MKKTPIEQLVVIMSKLRDPVDGCPWDLAQTFETIAQYTIEEAYEVADAVASGNKADLLEELGDLLFHVVYYAQLSREEGNFDFDKIVEVISEKMIRRHPHIFSETVAETIDCQTQSWEAFKEVERSVKTSGDEIQSSLAGVARALPALTRADKLAKRAARVGFDWPTTADVITKIEEELGETKIEISDKGSPERLKDEIGDLLFAVANLARKLDVDPEAALRHTNNKFTKRFAYVEEQLAQRGFTPKESGLDEMNTLWNEAKTMERCSPSA